jgi:hypothetical protein
VAGDEREPARGQTTEERLLRRLRIVAGIVLIAMLVLLVTADTLGRLLIDPNFHSSELIIGIVAGDLLLVLGIEVVNRLPGKGGGGGL